jgi:hypothetical protein
MSAGTKNFEIEQGANFSATLTWKDPDGNPIIITDYTIRMMARVTMEDAEPVITLSTVSPPGGIIITDGAGGKFQITMNAAQTAALNFNEALYDLEMVSPTGHVTRLIEGKIALKHEVTR